jgi:hypothetical protein
MFGYWSENDAEFINGGKKKKKKKEPYEEFKSDVLRR